MKGKFRFCNIHHARTYFQIEFFSQDMLPCIALYEYVLVTLYAKWAVNAINERIRRKKISVSILKTLYADVLECLRDFNRSIFGVPVLSFIGGHVADIIHGTYYNVIFFDKFVNKYYTRDQFFELCYLSTRLADLILLFIVCHATEKEVSFILISKLFWYFTDNPNSWTCLSVVSYRNENKNYKNFQYKENYIW